MPASAIQVKLILIFNLLIVNSSYSFQQESSVTFADSIFEEGITAKYNYDFVPDVPYEVVEDRISCIQTSIPLTFNTKVKGFVDYFTIRDRNYTRMILKRQHVYFPLFEKYLKKYNLPEELKYLAVVESGLNTKAVSRAGAVGLWQFMPATGRSFHLKQDYFFDERMDPEKATEAACKYLKELYGYFNDWELALASYNAGPGNVRKAIRKSKNKRSFWEVYNYLPKETRSYVPQFVAIIYVMKHAVEHNFLEEDFEWPIESQIVQVKEQLDLEKFAENLNVCLDDLLKLNPEIRRPIFKSQSYALKVPTDKIEFIAQNNTWIFDSSRIVNEAAFAYNHSGDTNSKIVYKVQKGDVLGKIAERHRVSVAQIKNWNNLSTNNIMIGQQLVIYSRNAPALTNSSVDSNSKTLYKVQKGDALGKIADKFQVSVEQLKTWNNLQTSNILIGQSLVIYSKASEPPSNVTAKSVPEIYMVQPGDSLWKISKKYDGLTVEKIKKLNNLKDNNIKVGQRLILGS